MPTSISPLVIALALSGCTTKGAIIMDTGADAGPCPSLSLSADSADFSDVPVGAFDEVAITVSNDCDGDEALEVVAFFQGDDVFSFSLSSEEIAPGESAALLVTFAPTDYDARSGAISLTTNDADTPEAVVYVSGSAFADSDEDGYEATQAGGEDCDDSDDSVNPEAAEIWYDGVDQDCSGDSDGDADGDGFDAVEFGGEDCDDSDASINPDALELEDGADQDCDGLLDEGFVDIGDVLVSEFMADPHAVTDTTGEWFELYNSTETTVDLKGWEVSGDDGDGFVIETELLIEPGGYVVLGLSDDATQNGGVQVDYVYDRDDFALSDSDDAIHLSTSKIGVFSMEYTASGWGLTQGVSVSLDPYFLDIDSAQDPNRWCLAQAEMPEGDLGTPGIVNGLCSSVDHDGDGLSEDAGDCDDADGGRSPETEELWDGLDQDCDDWIDDLDVADIADGVLTGGSYDFISYMGQLGSGDLDGDDDPELVVGGWYNGTYGEVYVLEAADYASWSGAASSYADALVSVSSTDFQYYFGGIPRVSADYTGDGVDDLLVAGGGYSTLNIQGISVAVFEGGVDFAGSLRPELHAADDAWLALTTEEYAYSTSYAASGDMDGDGVGDVIYGMNYFDNYAGLVGMYSGGGAGGAALLEDGAVYLSADRLDYLGEGLDAGDIDEDGYDDVMACAPGDDDGAENAGALYLLKGDGALEMTGDIGDSASAKILGSAANDSLCDGVSPRLGDINGDGRTDLVVGAPAISEVYIFLDARWLSGNVGAGSADITLSGADGPSAFGAAITLGNMDGDAADDLLIGAPDDYTNYAYYYADEPGAAWLFYGADLTGSSYTDSDASVSFHGVSKDGLGQALSLLDLNSDGTDDLVLGAPSDSNGTGAVYLLASP